MTVIEVERPLMPVTGDAVVAQFTGGEIGAGMGACALGHDEAIGIRQVEDRQLVVSDGDEFGVARGTVLDR
jgi:hypothetical protein